MNTPLENISETHSSHYVDATPSAPDIEYSKELDNVVAKKVSDENERLDEALQSDAEATMPRPDAATPIVAATDDRQNGALIGDDAERAIRLMSRRSFLWGAVAVGAGLGSWRWLTTRRTENGIPWPARRVLQTNEQLSRDYFNPNRMAPTFARSQVGELRVNGDIGLPEEFDAKAWQLTVGGLASGETMTFSMRDLKKLPRAEMTTELKCIEGWSTITHWAGARFSDFVDLVKPATQSGNAPDVRKNADDLVEYVSLTTPDNAYYVGLDMASALHPQTLLCYEMNDKPLTVEHGAPLRLVTPLKYGIKHIKRIGSINFTAQRPADYWAERGYDWYAGH